MELQSDMEIKEACGVFGIFNPNGEDAASSIYYGLCSLQHRGQESCGIAVCDTKGPKGNMNTHKGMGHTQTSDVNWNKPEQYSIQPRIRKSSLTASPGKGSALTM